MTRVNKNTWTATLDRTLLLHILWESGVTLRDWSGVAAALGPGFSTTICEYEILYPHDWNHWTCPLNFFFLLETGTSCLLSMSSSAWRVSMRCHYHPVQ